MALQNQYLEFCAGGQENCQPVFRYFLFSGFDLAFGCVMCLFDVCVCASVSVCVCPFICVSTRVFVSTCCLFSCLLMFLYVCVFFCEVWMRAKMKCQGTLSNLWKKHWNLSWLHSRIDASDQTWLNRSNPQSWLTDGVLVKTATVYGWALEVLARRMPMPRCCGRCLDVIR